MIAVLVREQSVFYGDDGPNVVVDPERLARFLQAIAELCGAPLRQCVQPALPWVAGAVSSALIWRTVMLPALRQSMQRLSKTLDRSWRLIGTALSFSAFGLGGIVSGLLIMPVVCLVIPCKYRRRVARRIISGGFKLFVELMRALRVLDYRIEGLDNAGALDGCLIVANHPSLIDVVFLLAIFREADCVVKAAHWSNPFTMASVRAAGYISNADPAALVDEAISRLRAGQHLLMFPEGSRTVPGAPLDLRRGAAMITLGVPAHCVPVLIRCTPTTLTKNEPWYRIPERRVLYEVFIHKPLDFPADDLSDSSDRQAAIARTGQLASYYEQALSELGNAVPQRASHSTTAKNLSSVE